MYVINVIPLIKIPYPNPQILSYFCSEKIKKGGVVKISIRNRKIKAIVLEQKTIEQEKIRLKKFADFAIKPIDKIIFKEAVLNEKQLKLLFWIADYYFAPLGLVAKIFLSKKSSSFAKATEDIQKLILTPKTKGLVFSAFKNLRSITIENEESPLHRSWGRKPYYNAKDIAIQLAKIHKAKLFLTSQLPSVETYYLSQKGKYKLQFPVTSYRLPATKFIDMCEELQNGNFSIISKELQESLTKSEKSILYIARRGTATFILCQECGYVSMCPNCDVPMVFHEDLPSKRLMCHHCGKQDIAPVLCPKCRSAKIKYFGAGTQKVETEIKKLHPNKTVLRLDSDITPKPIDQQKIIEKFNKEKNAILIGSQMLFSKNLKVDLVAVISLETILNLPDYKNSERVFQIINQLQKMASGEFLLQTYNPDNLTIKTALENNFEKFYNEEIKMRKKFIYPPFSQIIKLSFEHKSPEKAKNEAKILFEKLKQQIKNLKIKSEEIQIAGPVPTFIPRVKRFYSWNIVLKSKIKKLTTRNRLLIIVPSRWEIEVDPESLL